MFRGQSSLRFIHTVLLRDVRYVDYSRDALQLRRELIAGNQVFIVSLRIRHNQAYRGILVGVERVRNSNFVWL